MTRTRGRSCSRSGSSPNILSTCRGSGKARPAPAKTIVAKCLARLSQTDARELAARGNTWPHSEVSAVIRRDSADAAEDLRRHRRQLFRAFGHFPDGPGQRTMNYQHHPSHPLRIRRAGDGFAPCRRGSSRALTQPVVRPILADHFSRTGAAQNAAGLFRQPALFFCHPGGPQPAGDRHAQPGDRDRPQLARRRTTPALGTGGGACSATRCRPRWSSPTSLCLIRRRCGPRLNWRITRWPAFRRERRCWPGWRT